MSSHSQSQGWIADVHLSGTGQGPLKGLKFGLKDMYSVAGHTNSCGNPTWKETHEAAGSTAPAVQRLLDAGAELIGMTHMDELAYSLNGENVHYGTPRNAAAENRVPGGSSSGSASVVAGAEADFAIGSDTAGSVRVPAAYQGIFGFRPTHGRIPMTAATPLSPSFDTFGWFARDARTLQRVGGALLDDADERQSDLKTWLVAADAFAETEAVAAMIYDALSKRFEDVVTLLGQPQERNVAQVPDQDGFAPLHQLGDWHQNFKVIQASEVWQVHGDWIREHQPSFGPGVQERFEAAAKIEAADVEAAIAQRKRCEAHIEQLLGSSCFVTMPTVPGPAPLLSTASEEIEVFRAKALALTSLAGMCRLPQVTIPCGSLDDCPVGLSLVAPQYRDRALLELAVKLSDVLDTH